MEPCINEFIIYTIPILCILYAGMFDMLRAMIGYRILLNKVGSDRNILLG